MKKPEIDVAKEGLELLIGERVILLCVNYFYAGKLAAVSGTSATLEDASVVYETGEWGAQKWKDAQPIGRKAWYVRVDSIESYGLEAK